MKKKTIFAALAAFAVSMTAASAVSVDIGGGTIRADDVTVRTDTSVQVDAGTSGLSVLLPQGLDEESRGAIVALHGTTIQLITTDADLKAYGRLVAQERTAIVGVDADADGSVRVQYRQPTRFLGLLKTRIRGTVDVGSAGRVIVKLPWYGFLFSTDTTTVETAVRSDVDAAIGRKQISIGTSAGAGTTVSVRNGARVINVVTSSVDGTVSVPGN